MNCRLFLQSCSLVFVVSLTAVAGGVDDKLDEGLDNPDQMYPIFVRMSEQLFKRGGDYETFCKQNASRRRSDLRKSVLSTLKQNSEQSWQQVKETVAELEQQGAIKDRLRYWIVNGFACQASGEACRKLAQLEAVSFVYRNRLPRISLNKRQPRPNAERQAQMKQVYQQILDNWHDDSDEPVSVKDKKVSWNLERIKADQAWTRESATGKGVVVALCDSGLMVTPALTRALWRNEDEELNGQDDDGNGYADDLFGFDFGNLDPYSLGDGAQRTHGSMCGGILASRPINQQNMMTGVAPRARLMVLRGMGVLKSYEYALDNGADIMSMSFMWVGRELGNYRGLYRLAHEHMAAGGIVAVGGAGNFGPGARRSRQPKGKQIALPKDIPCVIAAAGILKSGQKAPAGSEGPCYWNGVKFYDDYPVHAPLSKPDVTGCFGGYPVWGRPAAAKQIPSWTLVSDEGNRCGLISGPQGNSFSGPHAGGVAALMLSVNPELPAWRVKRLMEQTCDDIGATGRDQEFGAGLLNALQAVRLAKRASFAN